MVTRKKYDSQNRVISKAITDDRGMSMRYTYTYNGDSIQPQRVNKSVNKIAELVYQTDNEGRLIYELDEETNIVTRVAYGKTYDDLRFEFDEISEFKADIPEDGIFDIKAVTDKEEEHLLVLDFTCPIDEEYNYKFLEDKYKIAQLKIDRKDFIDIAPSQKVNSKRFVFDFKTNSYTVLLLQDNYVVNYLRYDFNNHLIEEHEAITIIEEGRIHSFLATKRRDNGTEEYHAYENKTDKDFPYIPMTNNIYSRKLFYTIENDLILSTIDTTNEKTEDGGCKQIIRSTANYPDESYDYKVFIEMDDHGRVLHTYNENTQQDEVMAYNDQDLITERIITKKSNAPKKILFRAPVNQNKEIKHVQHYSYTEDGKLLLIATHNDLMCNFEAFEYDEKGREIFNATFSTYSE